MFIILPQADKYYKLVYRKLSLYDNLINSFILSNFTSQYLTDVTAVSNETLPHHSTISLMNEVIVTEKQ